MTPQVTCSGTTRIGTTAAGQKQWITRKLVQTVSLSGGTLQINSGTLKLPDGCKILKVVLRNLTGRTLTCEVPVGTALAYGTGSTDQPFGGFQKYASAPLSRFPKLVIQVPDLLAAELAGDAAPGPPLFTVGQASSGLTDTVEITATVRYAL